MRMARLEKSSKNRMLFGVAGGLAEYLRVDPVIIRVLFILLAFASGIGVFIYLILALIMPRPEAAEREPLEVVKDNLQTAPRETTEAGRRVVAILRGPTETPPGPVEPARPKDEETTPQ
jgi:phage shock protein C